MVDTLFDLFCFVKKNYFIFFAQYTKIMLDKRISLD